MPAQLSREYRIYLALWRKALKQPESAPTISVKCPNLHMAVAMRQGMYRAIKPYRNNDMLDKELKDAADKFVAYLEQGEKASDPHFIEFRERKSLKILENIWDDLGIDEDDLLVGDERKTGNALQQLLEETKTPKPARKTAFYEREQ